MACAVDKNGNCLRAVTLTNNAGLTACSTYDAKGYCWRKLTVKIVTDTVCIEMGQK